MCAQRSARALALLLIGWTGTAHAGDPKSTMTTSKLVPPELIAFTPPPNITPVEDPSPAPPAPAPAGTAPAAPVDEVRVVGRRTGTDSPTEHRMGRAEVRVVPGAFGDPFRAIDVSPSLVPLLSGLPYYYIRGAPPSAVGYYVDEVRVPYLFHFGLGPGVVQPALIDEVSLHPAAFPARYGRFAGGVVAGQTREPASELHAEGQLRLFDAGAYVEAPFAEGRGSVGVGGRYSYTAAIVSLAAPKLTIDYRDYNARASYRLSDRWRATAFAFGAFDYASQVENGRENVAFASEFHRLDLRLDRRGEDGATSRIAATFGFDRTRLEGTRFAQDMIAGVRGRHRWVAQRDFELELGADLLVDSYSGDLPNPYAVSREDYAQAEAFFSPRTETASGVWTSATLRPRAGWNITGTVRGDVFTSDGKIGIGPSPRISTRVPVVPKVAFLAALGIAPQPPAFAIPTPAVGYRGLPGGLSYAYQKSAGVEIALPLRFTLRTIGFHHTYLKLRDFAEDALHPDEPQPAPGAPTQAFGLEALLSRKLSERFAAFVSSTLSRSQLGSTPLQSARVSSFDRTYVVQIGGVADFGRGWRASTRFLTYGGWPLESGKPNTPPSERLPGLVRLDLRIEKRWTFQKERWLALVLEGLNVTGSRDVTGKNCLALPGASPSCVEKTFGPLIVPSLGLEGGL
jgi:hypothetical protein